MSLVNIWGNGKKRKSVSGCSYEVALGRINFLISASSHDITHHVSCYQHRTLIKSYVRNRVYDLDHGHVAANVLRSVITEPNHGPCNNN
jgi:hypothetical protein